MQTIVHITNDFAVTGELHPADLAEAAALGFRSVLNNRPDGEEDGQMTGTAGAANAWRAGLRYRHIPSSKLDLFTDGVVEGTLEALETLPRPILAHCKSGMRSAIIWAAASARLIPVDEVLAKLEAAGFELDFLRDELDAQADRRHWNVPAPHVEPQPVTADAA